MKVKWFHAKEDPLYLSLLLVVVLFFVALLAACFSFLIISEKRAVLSPGAWLSHKAVLEEKQELSEKKLTLEDMKVGEISGEITEIQENKITFKTLVYGTEEKTFSIILDQKEYDSAIKFAELEQKDQNGLPKMQKQKFDLAKLEVGNFITFRFPLEVPVAELGSESLSIEQVIVNDEYDPAQVQEQ